MLYPSELMGQLIKKGLPTILLIDKPSKCLASANASKTEATVHNS